ncbi:MAG: MBL fold metallo-hydrolase [Prevotellaceae bacterium]|jgi:L-ascorbate metabolism protein UlaG (beta-lactamase superfamily)|nr:MBL fold metallo-hydrolase [Prevotellaceae bacterium]
MWSKIIKSAIIVTVVLLFIVGCSAIRSTGKYPSKRKEAEFEKLSNYSDGAFQSPYGRTASINRDTIPRSRFRKERSSRFKKPKLSRDIPSIKTNLLDTSFTAPTIVWFGHSSYLIQSKGFTILVDPVFSGYGSPVCFVNKNINGSNIYNLKDLPPIDLLIITHDHYDHFDYKTVCKLRKTDTKAVVPMGVETTMDYWGWKNEKFKEVNWGDSLSIAQDILLVSTPTQHFSGRRYRRNKTLWTSYVLEIHGYRIFIGGDGGYNKHFKDIGDKYGPFDLALLENGQYSPYWLSSHCYPEQTVRAAIELQAKMILPVHWAKFSATYHPWNEPVKRLLPQADSLGVKVTVPKIGEPYTIGEPPKREVWWDFD